MIFTTFLVTLALCLSPFYSGGKRNVCPMRPSGSKVGIGLDPDGFSYLMMTCDPEEILSSEGSEDVETSPPCGASLWLGVEDF